MNILLVTSKQGQHARRVEAVASLINGCQRLYKINFVVDEDFAPTGSPVSPDALSKLLERKFPDQNSILVTEDSFYDNWFSHEYRSTAVITASDWESTFAPPSLRAFLLYQVAQALIHFSADMSEEIGLNIVHEPPVGCLYDMSANKPDIKLGMVAGNICHQCVGQLRALGTPDSAIDAVTQIVSMVRAEALGRPVAFDPKEVFIVMRCTTNDENDNAWKYGIKAGIERCGLRATRGDDRVESTHILDKVDKAIRRCRLVVAKVDEDNLNVYYELGLAMGVGKDVLLISENNLAINLPSDLRSLECLTYQKGNYEQLADRVEKFILDHYHVTR